MKVPFFLPLNSIYFSQDEERTYRREDASDPYSVFRSVPYLLFSPDFLWTGRPVHNRAVQRCLHHHCRGSGKPGYAHAHCSHSGAFHGRHHCHRKGSWSQGFARSCKERWKHCHHLPGVLCTCFGNSCFRCRRHNKAYRDPARGSEGDPAVPYHLLCGNSVHHRIQCDKQHIQGLRRHQDPHVLCACGRHC